MKRKAEKSIPSQVTMTEADLRRSIVAAARECGWMVYFSWTSIHSPAGMPDLVLCRPPQLVFAELKSDKGKVLPNQQVWLDTLAQVPGVRVFVWRPTDLEAAYRFLAGIEEELDAN